MLSVSALLATVVAEGLAQSTPSAAAAPRPANPFAAFNSPEAQATRARNNAIATADRQRMMDLLGVKEPGPFPPAEDDPNRPQHLRQIPGRSVYNWYDDAENTHVRSGWGNWTNYDYSKSGPSSLPDPLELKNGRRVKDADTWWKKRRPEIVADFKTEIYGRIPADPPEVTFEVVETDARALDGRAKFKRIVGHIDNSRYPAATPSIQVSLWTPANATGPVPVMVVIGGGGPGAGTAGLVGTLPAEIMALGEKAYADTLERVQREQAAAASSPEPTPAAAPAANPAPSRPPPTATRDMILAKGWGYATFNPGAVQADTGAGLNLGIIGLVNRGQPRQPDDWGSLAAISWGLSRAIDYFESDPDVDAKRLGVEGHSRWGKATLVALAYEPRWAIGYSSCSGECGAKLHRHNIGQQVDNVCGVSEYHWMAGNFLKYAGNWDKLPIDQHQLIALIAPRPVFVTGGTTDLWSDPVGEFKACVAAGPVYRLLGKKDVGQTEMPAPDEELIDGDIGYRMHEGGHVDYLDWPTFLKFADKYFSSPQS